MRASAICLLLLAMSPLTAPFSTLDLAAIPSQSGPQDSALKLSQPSGAAVTKAYLPEPASLDRASGRAATPPNLTSRQQLEQRVLRI